MRIWILCCLLLSGGPLLATSPVRPRLVLQVTVDQLRGDMLSRHGERLGAGGFRRLMEGGAWFANAHYDSSNTVTAAGHAVLATGARTPGHGIVANDWYDREAGRTVYCVADPSHPPLESSPRPGTGFSPANLLASTLADEIVAGVPAARAFAVAGKERGAILMAGRRGKAYWFSDRLLRFTSSTFYHRALPAWIEAWNAGGPVEPYRTAEWRPLSGSTGGVPENVHARPEGTIGRTFPHPLRARSDALFLAGFKCTPFFDAVIAAFARELIIREGLGREGTTDYLAVSFSGQDYIGHAFGPESAEYADALVRLDRELGELFAVLDRVVGADRVLIALSSDHGCADIPEAARAQGFEARRLQPKELLAEWNAQLRSRLRVEADLIAAFVPPSVYLDRARVAGAGLDPATVAKALAEVTRASPGVAEAFTAEELRAGVGAPGSLRGRVERSFHPRRSGDVVIVQSPFWYLYPDPEGFGAMHGSPYTYDTFVPILLAGPGVRPAVSRRAVTPAQLAPTLAALLGLKPPSAADGGDLLPVFAEAASADRQR